MSPKVLEFYEMTRSFNEAEIGELLGLFFDDPKLRENLIDIALIKQAESEGDDYVTMDELLAGKRTYER